MSVAPHSGIVDFGTFTPPGVLVPGVQGEVPAPLVAEAGYVLSTSGWVPASVSGTASISNAARFIQMNNITGTMILRNKL